MRLASILTYLSLATSVVNASSIPDARKLEVSGTFTLKEPRSEILSSEHRLEKRRGAGGRSGGGGSSSGGKSGSGGIGGSSKPSNAQPNSNAGGKTSSGSGIPRTYGGGAYYGGGATVPYSSGSRTPRGLAPGLLLFPAAALLIFPGLWLYNVYPYHLNPYRFINETVQNATNGVNQTLPVLCLCQEYSVCGCDNTDDQSNLEQLVGNGSYAALNKSLITVADVNGTTNIVLNGTLENGTTAPGGTDSAAAGLYVGWFSTYWIAAMMTIPFALFL